MNETGSKLTPAACRAGRALLGIGVRDLGELSGVGFASISAFENGRPMRESNKAKVVAAFLTRGVEITNGDGTGARLKNLGGSQ